ncbi:hypothetical protein F4781DRAFT_436976 [Annulohypoxylon bovei var. microspora]|nr:hypothetical protein F4781DRAFT_436976 [Annulohypoxylon bovei var. microspora]
MFIVPNLPDDPSTQEVAIWESIGPKDYKWRILDPEAEILDEPLEVVPEISSSAMTIRDLDERQLSFKSDIPVLHPSSRLPIMLEVPESKNGQRTGEDNLAKGGLFATSSWL